MQKFILFLLCLIFLLGLSPKSGAQCSLPAPENFSATATGPGWVTLEWDLVPGAAQYKLDLVNLTTNQNWAPIFTEGTNDDLTINGITPGYYRATIRSVCPNGTAGYDYRDTYFNNYIVVIDLVAGYNPPSAGTPVPACQVEVTGCTIPWTPGAESMEFKISKTFGSKTVERLFVVVRDGGSDGESGTVVAQGENSKNTISMGCNSSGNVSCPNIDVQYSSFHSVLKIERDNQNTSAIVYFVHNDGLFNLQTVRLVNYSPTPTFGKMSSAAAQPCGDDCNNFKSVNPFDNQIELFFLQAPQNPLTFTLCDAQGRQIKTLQISDPGEQVTIPATEFNPGFYFLSVQNGQEIKTVRLVKL